MKDTTRQDRSQSGAKASSGASDRQRPPNQSKQRQPTSPDNQETSSFEKFAATQAAGDGIQGDTLKKDKTVDEKIGAQMADRK
jgi:hypothetical protein